MEQYKIVGPSAVSLMRSLLQEITANDDWILDARTGTAIGVTFVAAALDNSIGGGLALWVPIFNALCGLVLKAAIPLSQACVACGTLGATCYNVLCHHSIDDTRPMIDYGMVLVMMPALVTGTSIGVLLNNILPSIVLVSILIIMLLCVAARTFYHAVRLRAKEKQAATAEQRRQTRIKGSGAKDDSELEDGKEGCIGASKKSLSSQQSRLKKSWTSSQLILQRAATLKWKDLAQPILPWHPIIEVFLVAGCFLGFQIGKDQYYRCSWQFWLLLGLQLAFMAGASAIFVWVHNHALPPRPAVAEDNAREKQEVEEEGTLEVPEETNEVDETWNNWHLSFVWLLVLAIGIIAGMVGVGGGIIVSPLLLEFRVHPQTAAATSTLIVFISSSLATITYALDDRLNLSYWAVYGPLCFVGGVVGVVCIGRLVKKYSMASLVAFVIATLAMVSAGLVAGFGAREAVESIINGVPVTVASMCQP